MKIEFTIDKNWTTGKGLKALQKRQVTEVLPKGCDIIVAKLTYPTIQFWYEAWVITEDGDDIIPCDITEKNIMDKDIDTHLCFDISFSRLVFQYGNEDFWSASEYINDVIDFHTIDFTDINWKENLMEEMTRIANVYANMYEFKLYMDEEEE